jgi:hypothetical protein
MESSAEMRSLAKALNQVREPMEKRCTIPILSHVLVEACANGLRPAPPTQSHAPAGKPPRTSASATTVQQKCCPNIALARPC